MALQKASSVGASYRPLGGRTTRGGRAVSLRQWQDRPAGAEGPLNGLVGDPQGVADIFFLGQLCFSKAGVKLGNIK